MKKKANATPMPITMMSIWTCQTKKKLLALKCLLVKKTMKRIKANLLVDVERPNLMQSLENRRPTTPQNLQKPRTKNPKTPGKEKKKSDIVIGVVRVQEIEAIIIGDVQDHAKIIDVIGEIIIEDQETKIVVAVIMAIKSGKIQEIVNFNRLDS